MQAKKRQRYGKRIIFTTLLIFLAAFVIFLILWIQVKDYYSYAVIHVGSQLVAAIKGVQFEGLMRKNDVIQAIFSPFRYGTKTFINVPVKTSNYTYNAPLTLAILAALWPFIRRRAKAYAYAILVLFAIHLLCIASFEARAITDVCVARGYEPANATRYFFYEFLWGFTSMMVMRFEPFLIGVYIFLRFRLRA